MKGVCLNTSLQSVSLGGCIYYLIVGGEKGDGSRL